MASLSDKIRITFTRTFINMIPLFMAYIFLLFYILQYIKYKILRFYVCVCVCVGGGGG